MMHSLCQKYKCLISWVFSCSSPPYTPKKQAPDYYLVTFGIKDRGISLFLSYRMKYLPLFARFARNVLDIREEDDAKVA